jgi:hypothetical protein
MFDGRREIVIDYICSLVFSDAFQKGHCHGIFKEVCWRLVMRYPGFVDGWVKMYR